MLHERQVLIEPQNSNQKEVVTFCKELSIVYSGWGNPVTNEELINRFPQEVEAVIGTGMTIRHHPPENEIGTFVDNKAQIGEKMINHGVSITRECLRANSWDGEDVDAFVVTSSAPPDEQGEWAREIARGCNINPEVTKTYYLACAGAAVALLDSLKDQELQGKRVVITAVEALGYLVDPQNVIDRATFGNGVTSIAFIPGKNIEVFTGKTIILPDIEETICSPYCYDALSLKPDKLPDYYELTPGSELVFVYSRRYGSHLNLPLSKSRRVMEMDGIKVARRFKYLVPPLVEEICLPFADQLEISVSHQPSLPVLRHQARMINKINKKLPNLEIPWVMDKVGMGNVSSATTLIAFAEIFKQGKIPFDKPFNITSYGVGSAITSMVVKLNSEQ